jgi:hypothetical protein
MDVGVFFADVFSLTYLLATRLTSLVGMPLASTAVTASRASA